jgi:hypothetical protein
VCSQIWLNHLIGDRHFSYIKNLKKQNPGPQMANKEKKKKHVIHVGSFYEVPFALLSLKTRMAYLAFSVILPK